MRVAIVIAVLALALVVWMGPKLAKLLPQWSFAFANGPPPTRRASDFYSSGRDDTCASGGRRSKVQGFRRVKTGS